MSKFSDAYDLIASEIKKDPGLYYAYQSNIAMAFQDELLRRNYRLPDQHSIANQAAKNFLDMWIKKSESERKI